MQRLLHELCQCASVMQDSKRDAERLKPTTMTKSVKWLATEPSAALDFFTHVHTSCWIYGALLLRS